MQDYKRLDSTTVDIYVPENRRIKTDENFLLSKKILFGLFLILFAYTASHSFLNWTSISDLENSAHITGSGDALKPIIEELKGVLGEVILSVLISLVLSALTLVLFRYYVGFIVWLMIGLIVAVFVIISIVTFVEFANGGQNDAPAIPLMASLFTVLLVFFLVAMKKYISLAIELFREAAKSVICMSKLLAVPFITSILVILVTGLFVFFVTVIESASLSAPQAAFFTRWYNILIYCWFVQFLMGCQHIIVAGAVGKWFFTRDKTNLGDPVLGSARNLWHFHLGTVAFGSLVIMTIKILRSLIKSLKQLFKRLFCCCCYSCCCGCITNCCCDNLGRFLEYLSHSAYIITSIFGLDFIDAGEKAFKMIMKHAVKIFTVHILIKFIMFAGKVFVVGVTVWISSLLLNDTKLDNVELIYVLNGLFAYIVIQGFFDTYEIAVDTIIIGFCTDCDVNNGLSKPYYMSVQLVAFLERAKVIGGDNEIAVITL